MHKIIVIEDDKFLLENIEIILTAEGFKVFTADTGQKAIALIEAIIPDVIISDIMLPDTNGYEILKAVRNNPEISDLPFLFLTARSSREELRQGMSLGADDYLTKPFTAKELTEAINARLLLINRRRNNPHPAGKSTKVKDSVFIKDLKGIVNISLEEIIYIKASGEYTVIGIKEKEYIVKKLLGDWEEILPDGNFLRIHRSVIINIKHIARLENWFNHSFRIHMQNCPEPFISSRRYTSKIKDLYFI